MPILDQGQHFCEYCNALFQWAAFDCKRTRLGMPAQAEAVPMHEGALTRKYTIQGQEAELMVYCPACNCCNCFSIPVRGIKPFRISFNHPKNRNISIGYEDGQEFTGHIIDAPLLPSINDLIKIISLYNYGIENNVKCIMIEIKTSIILPLDNQFDFSVYASRDIVTRYFPVANRFEITTIEGEILSPRETDKDTIVERLLGK